MQDRLLNLLKSDAPGARDRSLAKACAGATTAELLDACSVLQDAWRGETNLYTRVRTLLFLAALQRLHLPASGGLPSLGTIPADAVALLNQRRFAESIECSLTAQTQQGPNEALGSILAAAYRGLAFDTLAQQVRKSVRSFPGNRWLFSLSAPGQHPHPVLPALRGGATLIESTPVRMDFSHSAWSDIFFLAMDAPEAARVLNVSIDLAVRGGAGGSAPRPPVEVRLAVIDAACLRLTSVDLGEEVELTTIASVFDFAADHLGLLRAGLVAGGLIPPGLEDQECALEDLLIRLLGPGRGLHLVTHVQGIPKGSRLAVSTNLLAAIIAAVMRATGQTESLTGALGEDERRLICARAILGEWLGGSGGGWQDSAGLWPGIKLIEGALAQAGDPEWGVSRGRLLPQHRLLGADDCPSDMAERLSASLVLAHGGLAQDVGPVLELVTEKYLLRDPIPTAARATAGELFEQLTQALRAGDIAAIGRLTHETYHGPLQAIIPWAANAYTETVVARLTERFGQDFWGFWMLGGMAGGGMGFLFDPAVKEAGRRATLEELTLAATAQQHEQPFAMAPVVYDFAVNHRGSWAELDEQRAGPADPVHIPPRLGATHSATADPAIADRAIALPTAAHPTAAHRDTAHPGTEPAAQTGSQADPLDGLLAELGFDRAAHDRLSEALRSGRIGCQANRLPADTEITDAQPGDVAPFEELTAEHRQRGAAALAAGEVAVVTLAGGLGSRWTRGAGVVKALNPFWPRDGAWRSFLDVHEAKCSRAARRWGTPPAHVITTSWLTHEPIAAWAGRQARGERALLSPGRGVGLRMIPTERDLNFLWHETGRQLQDEQSEKVADSSRAALLAWANARGQGSDYRDNLAEQCVHPLGHGHELASLALNGTLRRLLDEHPQTSTLLLHNVDTLGVDLDAGLLGRHLDSGPGLTIEVLPRRAEDRGGGLARVDGALRLVESIALPHESLEWRLSWYNSLTTWIDVDHWLGAMELDREALADEARVARCVARFIERLPVYVTLKDVKQRWGHGHEDVYVVSQWERLWGDVSTLPELNCRFAAVPLRRGRQLKDPEQLDTWRLDGSADHVASLCDWPRG